METEPPEPLPDALDMGEVTAQGASTFLAGVLDECVAIHQTIYETFVSYPLEQRLPA